MKTEFVCSCCKKTIVHESDFSTGYGVTDNGQKLCFDCCGEQDKNRLIETGKLPGYFTKDKDGRDIFTNWPGTFVLPVYFFRKSWHNFAGKNGRTDFWVKFNGNEYHGVQIGHNSQCATIKRTKTK
jgi:hypothetical protein